MTLGASFPPDYLRDQLQRRLVPGAVIKIRARMDDGQVREKRFVVLAVSESTMTCVINTRISRFIQHRGDLHRCQVPMPVSAHDFMDHDSFVDCSRIRSYPTAVVLADLCRQPDWVLGQISPALRQDIATALKFAPTLSAAEIAEVCAVFDAGTS
jgi:hypothetical protein